MEPNNNSSEPLLHEVGEIVNIIEPNSEALPRTPNLRRGRSLGERSSSRVSFADSPASQRKDNPITWKERFTQPSTYIYGPIPFLFFLQNMILFTMLPEIQAKWFTKCDEKLMGKCKPDYESAQAVGGIIDSLRNLFAFFSVALVGRLSDVFGRKPVLAGLIIVSSLPVLSLFLTDSSSPAVYYTTVIICGMFGVGSTPTAFASLGNAYVADTYSSEERSFQFGLMFAFSTASTLLNPVVGHFTDGLAPGDVYLTCLFALFLLVVYSIVILPESLDKEKRNEFQCGRTMNPLAPLKLISQSKVMRWISLVHFLSTAAELGVKEIALVYVDDVLNLEGSEARSFNRTLFFFLGTSMMFVSSFVLKFLLRLNFRPSSLFSLAQANNAIHIAVYILLSYMPYKTVILLNAIPTGFISLATIASSSLVSANMGDQEQGFAMGTLSAIAGIADIISPLVYSELFSYFGKKYHMPMVPFALGVICASASGLVAYFGPLRSLEIRQKRMLAPSHSVLYERLEGSDDDESTDDLDDLLFSTPDLAPDPAQHHESSVVPIHPPPPPST